MSDIPVSMSASPLLSPTETRLLQRTDQHESVLTHSVVYEKAMLAEAGGTVTDKTGPEKGGACQCWASYRGGWSYIQKVNKVSVSILRNYNDGGRPFSQTIPFDKLTGIMTAAEVQARRNDGLLIESSDGIGFSLQQPPPPDEAHKIDPEVALRSSWDEQGVPRERQDELIADVTAKAQPGAKVGPFALGSGIEAMRQSLKTGVQVVTAPQLFPTPPHWPRVWSSLLGSKRRTASWSQAQESATSCA